MSPPPYAPHFIPAPSQPQVRRHLLPNPLGMHNVTSTTAPAVTGEVTGDFPVLLIATLLCVMVFGLMLAAWVQRRWYMIASEPEAPTPRDKAPNPQAPFNDVCPVCLDVPSTDPGVVLETADASDPLGPETPCHFICTGCFGALERDVERQGVPLSCPICRRLVSADQQLLSFRTH